MAECVFSEYVRRINTGNVFGGHGNGNFSVAADISVPLSFLVDRLITRAENCRSVVDRPGIKWRPPCGLGACRYMKWLLANWNGCVAPPWRQRLSSRNPYAAGIGVSSILQMRGFTRWGAGPGDLGVSPPVGSRGKAPIGTLGDKVPQKLKQKKLISYKIHTYKWKFIL